jgi:hypothetical protein
MQKEYILMPGKKGLRDGETERQRDLGTVGLFFDCIDFLKS